MGDGVGFAAGVLAGVVAVPVEGAVTRRYGNRCERQDGKGRIENFVHGRLFLSNCAFGSRLACLAQVRKSGRARLPQLATSGQFGPALTRTVAQQ